MRKQPKLDEEVSVCKLTGNVDRTFRISGTICPKISIEMPHAKRHAAYTLIDLDLEDVEAFLDEAYRLVGERTSIPPPNAKLVDEYVHSGKEPLPRVIKGLWFSAIIIYAKCFTQAQGRKVKLEKSCIPAQMRPCHDKIMNYRNTIIAHAGEGDLETAEPELVISPKGSSHPHYWVRSNVSRVEFSDDRNEKVTFQSLVNAVHEHVRKKRVELTVEIIDEVRKVPLDTWYVRANLTSTATTTAIPNVKA